MDPNFLNRMEYFPGLNSPNMDPGSQQNAESSSAGAVPPGLNDDSLWNPSLALGMSDETTPAFLYAQQNLGGIPYSGYGGAARTPRPADAIQAATAARKRGGHDRKRAKMSSDAAALESVDYWINLDDDDHDNRLGGSFEIDYSGRNNETPSFTRYVAKAQFGGEYGMRRRRWEL
ncbi:hypothetical protein IMZ48_07475 [Candidatus Bathyarchaeota archaeon]|nr:hypothetical protein [Candidatus Bathyarchaeota archaeon]